MKKLLSIATVLAALAGTATAAPYVLPSPQPGALNQYDVQPVYGVEAIYAIGDHDMVDTYGVRGSFSLYNDADGTFRHRFSLNAGIEFGDETEYGVKMELTQIPLDFGYDLDIQMFDNVFLCLTGKAGYTLGDVEIDSHSEDFSGFNFRVGAGIKVQCSDDVHVRVGYEFGRTFVDEDWMRHYGQHIISVGVGCRF